MTPRWSTFQRRSTLVDHGPVSLRSAAVDILENSIIYSDPYPRILELIKRDSHHLLIEDLVFDLEKINRIFVIGAGKATQPIAQAVEELLQDQISEGMVILKRGETHYLNRIQIIEAAHPVPDQASLNGAKELVRIAKKATQGDLVISAFTGGSSALLVWPANKITLRDKQNLNRILLDCGASIQEINAVRKHVSRVKGGHLGQQVFPADLINLTVSDVIGDPLDCITDPTVPDNSTFLDAWATLRKYDLWGSVPLSIRHYLERGFKIETPKAYSHPYHSFIAVPSDAACKEAARRCRELGFDTYILTSSMEGESHEAAINFVETAREIIRISPSGKKFAFISSGETTVTLEGMCGEGGRNQEFALSAAIRIKEQKNLVVASLATDGTDGPTDACGGLIDGETITRARAAGFDPEKSLSLHQSKPVLEATGDLLVSGPTGTNINDVALLLIGDDP